MKKLFFMSFLAAALFSCSEKGLVTGSDEVTDGDSQISYLSVNIVSGQVAGTRADEGDFKVGSETENEVKAIRFYFFGKDGEAVAVKSNGATHYDATADEISNDYQSSNEGNSQNIESKVSAVITIESSRGDEKPYYVAAVVNPTAATPTLSKEQTVKVLQEAVNDFSTTNGFVMSSSVYKASAGAYSGGENDNDWKLDEGNDMEYIMVPVYDNIQPTRLEALDKPATIYVERVLAKVSASINITASSVKDVDIINENTYSLYPVGKIDQGAEEGENTDVIYAKFLGWNVTATRKTSRLVKQIDIEWAKDNNFIFDAGWNSLSWNDSQHFRSYWAINPPFTNLETDYEYGNFGEGTELGTSENVDKTPKSANYISFAKNNSYTYLQENAGSGTSGKTSTENDERSKIIVAAQLVDKDGKPLELVEWGGNVYKKNDALMTSLAHATGLYVVNVNQGTKDEPATGRYKQLSGDDIEFVHTAPENADAAYDDGSGPKYYVSIKLSDEKKYAIRSGDQYDEGDGGYESAHDKVQKALNDVGKIKYWNNGYTYYWVDIKHLGGDVAGDSAEEKKEGIAKYGVVRNHWYDFTFTSVKGLGVPVPDPGETIYPETPDDPTEFYLAAEIKILSWRMVRHDNEGLGWD